MLAFLGGITIQPDINQDGSPKSYPRKDGSHKVVLRGNLLKIKFMTVNGEFVVHAEKPAEASVSSSDDSKVDAQVTASDATASAVEEEAAA